MPTAQVLMDRAFRSLGVLRVGASASGDTQAEGLAMLNALIDRWSAENLVIPQVVQSVVTLTPGDGEYTIGTGQDIDIGWPIGVEETSYIRFNNADYRLVELTRQMYNAITVKSSQGLPNRFFYDNLYPVGHLYLYPIPVQAYELHLDTLQPIGGFASAATSISLRPAYESAIWTNLARDLWTLYPNPDVRDAVYRSASENRGVIERLNARVPVLGRQVTTGARYNVYADR